MKNPKRKKCSKCKGEDFHIEAITDCETCYYNGAYLDTAGYIYDQENIEYNQIDRVQAEHEGECGLGDSFNEGCHCYTCAKCHHKTNLPMLFN